MGEETGIFIFLTGIIVMWGILMPMVLDVAGESSVTNDVENLLPVEDTGVSYTEAVDSMIRAFFWYYGELNIVANAIKIIINFTWFYLLARLIRGGG